MNQNNPEKNLTPSKHQTIQQYINEKLQLKTLKIKKFSFQNTFSTQINSSKKLRNSLTTRQGLNTREDMNQFNLTGWEPKLSYRKIMKQPKILLSVERRKIKTSESIRKANTVFSTPKSRLGFRGQKIRSQSFFIQKSQQKVPTKLVIESTSNIFQSQKKQKNIPNFHFNLKYVIEQRKKGRDNLSIEQRTKQGSNKGYFAYFGSQNFTNYLEKNAYHANTRLQNKTHNVREKEKTSGKPSIGIQIK